MTSDAEWLLPGKEKGVHNLLAKFVTTGGPTFTFGGSVGPQSDWATIDGLGRLRNADETITKTDGSTVDHSYTYLYDMRSELTEATITNIDVGDWTGIYHYKKNGDMDYRTIQASQTNFTYTGNLMVSAAGGESFTLTWDENGNMKKLPDDSVTTELIYNWDNKLRHGQYDTKMVDLKYDPSGNRIFKDSSEETYPHKYLVDIVGKLPTILLELEEVNPGEHSVVKTYIYANSQIIAQHDGKYDQTRYFYLHDRLGSVRQIIDTSGNVKNRYTYRPFGEIYDDEGEVEETITNPFKFTGQYFDSEIDEYYLRARQYDPHIGRFTSRDPVRGKFKEPMTLHAYLYCLNDPVNRIDPDGRFAGLANLLVSNAILGSLRKLDTGFSVDLWNKSASMGQVLNMMQISRAVKMELILAEFEGGLTKAGIGAITAFIAPFVEKVNPVLAASLLTEREGIWELLKEKPLIEDFWNYFLEKLPGAIQD